MEKIYKMRYIISIPFYAEGLQEVEQAMDKIAKAVEVPYISVSSQDGTTGKRTWEGDYEYED
jgi:tagatose-1,6-bisphosphate aldolase